MAKVRANNASGGGGALQIYDTYINNGKPGSNVIDCGFEPKAVFITSTYNNSYWRLYWTANDPDYVLSAYQNSVTKTAIGSSALTVNSSGITIDSTILNGLFGTIFALLIVG